MDVLSYLQQKGFKVRLAPGEYQMQCPFCGDKNKYGHLYVNREHGAFMCHRCGASGSFYTFQTMLGDTPAPLAKELASKWEVWHYAVGLCQDALLDQSEVLEYLRVTRGFSAETIAKYQLGWVPRDLTDQMLHKFTLADLKHAGLVNEKNYPLMWDRILIPYLDRSQVVTLRAKAIGGNVIQAKDTSVHLFGVDNIRGRAEVFLCEGEFDAMLLDQYGYPACAIPGALSFQEHWVNWFDEVRRVFVVLDADDAGRRGAYKVQQLLGRKARLIELPVPRGEETTDVTEFFLRDLHTKEEFDEMVEAARGQRLFSVEDSLKARDALYDIEGVKLGFYDIDASMWPGLLPGQVMTILAKTGTGKTALLTQILHNTSAWESFDQTKGGPGLPVLFLSLEQTRAEIGNRLERVAYFHNPWASREEISRWYSRFRINDENRIPPEDVRIIIEEYIEEMEEPPKLILIDYLGYWARAFSGSSRYEQVSEAIMELKRIAKDFEVPVIAPHQVSRVVRPGERIDIDSARDSGVVEESSDFMLALRRPFEKAEEKDNVGLDYRQAADTRLEIVKSRHGGKGREAMLLWAPYSLALIPRGSELEERLRTEWVMDAMQMQYSDVLAVHRRERFI